MLTLSEIFLFRCTCLYVCVCELVLYLNNNTSKYSKPGTFMVCSFGSFKLMWHNRVFEYLKFRFHFSPICVDYVGYSSLFQSTPSFGFIGFLFVQVGGGHLTSWSVKLENNFNGQTRGHPLSTYENFSEKLTFLTS